MSDLPESTSNTDQEDGQQSTAPERKASLPVVAQPPQTIQSVASKVQITRSRAPQAPAANTQEAKTQPETNQSDNQNTELNARSSVNSNPAPTKKLTKKQEKERDKEMEKKFWDEVTKVYALGHGFEPIASEALGKVHEELNNKYALPAMAYILGIVENYIDPASPSQKVKYIEHLKHHSRILRYKKNDSRTTEFHLLSRQFRQSDRKQASADAIVLIKARKAGQTSKTFIEWVKENGGYEAVRTNKDLAGDDSDDQKEQSGSGSKSKSGKKTTAFKKWRRLAYINDANLPPELKALPTNVRYDVTIYRYWDRIDIMIYEVEEKSEDKQMVEPASSTTEQHELIQSSVGYPTLEENHKVVADE